MFKTRCFPESNYKAIYLNGKTLRIALNPDKPITELEYPEFYDVKITEQCFGGCPYCYQSSNRTGRCFGNILKKIDEFFGSMDDNQKPFQVALGGGEPTSHPDFVDILRKFGEYGIAPNYTTNGMWIYLPERNQILEATKKYCTGVAVSCHPHLERYWRTAAITYITNGVFTNLHIIIHSKKSIDSFLQIYNTWKGQIKYFVLLPMSNKGRGFDSKIEWDYLVEKLKEFGDIGDIAFGANFYPYLKNLLSTIYS